MQPVSPNSIPAHLPSTPALLLDQDGRIRIDVACLSCGYNLRTQLPGGRCPECNAAVGFSIQGNFLKFAEPGWVRKLASGLNWWVGGSVFAMVAMFFGVAIIADSGLPGAILPLVPVLAAIPMLYGVWKATTPDPSGAGDSPGITSRKLTRFSLFTPVVFIPSQYLLANLPGAHLIMAAIAMIVSVISTFAMFVYARTLALRIPNISLAKHFRFVMWGWIFVLVSAAATLTLFAITFPQVAASHATTTQQQAQLLTSLGYSTHGPGPTSHPARRGTPPPNINLYQTSAAGAGHMAGLAFMTLSNCAMGFGSLIFGIWSLILVLRIRRALNDAAREALSTWARPATAIS